jgi:AraC-like DNA-binding protein
LAGIAFGYIGERMPAPPLPNASLIAPRRTLASCVRAYITRDTTLMPPLPHEQRYNHFPATAFCNVMWLIEGESRCLAGPQFDDPEGRVARVTFSGPQNRPSYSHNPGPVRGFILTLFSPSMHALTGIDVAAYTDRLVPAEQVFDEHWLAMTQAVLHAPDDPTRVRLIEEFLEPQWRRACEESRVPGNMLGDWLQALLMYMVTSGWGRSMRNLERRIKAWAGHPMRTLRRLNRAEQSFLSHRDQVLAGHTRWADVAISSGYADQAHFCRETREVTGLSPTELLHRIQHDESYWAYRIWS